MHKLQKQLTKELKESKAIYINKERIHGNGTSNEDKKCFIIKD